MVEGAPLLREYTRKGIMGSNPILSAIVSYKTDFQAAGRIHSCRFFCILRAFYPAFLMFNFRALKIKDSMDFCNVLKYLNFYDRVCF